jgi:hypothetical protein
MTSRLDYGGQNVTLLDDRYNRNPSILVPALSCPTTLDVQYKASLEQWHHIASVTQFALDNSLSKTYYVAL